MKKVICADIMFLVTLLSQFAGAFLVVLLYSGNGGLNNGLSLLLTQLIIALPVIILLIRHKAKNPDDSIMEYMGIKKMRIGTIFLVIVFSVLIRFPITLINAISMLFVENEVQNSLAPMVGSQPLIVSLILIGIVPGMFEEFVYRGYFFGTYKRHGFWRGVIFSSLIFGMMHLNFNQFGYALFMGIAMCLLAEATGSILGGMIVHFCINGSSVVLLWALPKLIELLKENFTPEQLNEMGLDLEGILDTAVTHEAVVSSIAVSIVPAIIGTVLAGLLLYAIACVEKRKKEFLTCFGKGDLADRKKSVPDRPLAPYENRGVQAYNIEENAPFVPNENTDSHFVEENVMAENVVPSKERKYPTVLYYITSLLCIAYMVYAAFAN